MAAYLSQLPVMIHPKSQVGLVLPILMCKLMTETRHAMRTQGADGCQGATHPIIHDKHVMRVYLQPGEATSDSWICNNADPPRLRA